MKRKLKIIFTEEKDAPFLDSVVRALGSRQEAAVRAYAKDKRIGVAKAMAKIFNVGLHRVTAMAKYRR